jgi:hypothetical protein
VLKKRVRTIKFEGDIGGYVNELAIVTFMGVKNTSDWFQAGFKEHVMISGESFLCFIRQAENQTLMAYLL